MRIIFNKTSALRSAKMMKGMGILVCLTLALVLVNCDQNFFESTSDDDSYDARLEKGIMALDDEDYGKAISIFEGLRKDYPEKQEVCEYLSSAYAGYIGVDSLSLLETIDAMEADGIEDAGNIEIVGRILGEADTAVLTTTDVDNMRSFLAKAIEDTFVTCIPEPDDDQAVQLGVMAFFDAALVVAQIVFDDLGPGQDEIVLTEEGLSSLYAVEPDFSDIPTIDDYMTALNRDLDYVGDAVAVLDRLAGGDDNDLLDAFNDFLDDLGYDDIDGVTYQDLENYIATL